jgi:hypothetical protein
MGSNSHRVGISYHAIIMWIWQGNQPIPYWDFTGLDWSDKPNKSMVVINIYICI